MAAKALELSPVHYLRRRGAARYLCVSLGTLDSLVKSKKIPVIRPSPRVVLFRLADVELALQRFRVSEVGGNHDN